MCHETYEKLKLYIKLHPDEKESVTKEDLEGFDWNEREVDSNGHFVDDRYRDKCAAAQCI